MTEPSHDPALSYSYLTPQQVDTLLRPLNRTRIENRSVAGQKLSYLAHQDVRAHLTRIFGMARWSAETLDTEMVIEEPCTIGKDNNTKPGWYIAHRARMQLSICAPNGEIIARYTESAIAGSKQPEKHEAMDMSLKSATSDALKRCAINLGDQFGLSLYEKSGVQGSFVKNALIRPTPDDRDKERLEAEAQRRAAEAAHNPGATQEADATDITAIAVPLDADELARAEEQIAHSMPTATEEQLPDPAPETAGDQAEGAAREPAARTALPVDDSGPAWPEVIAPANPMAQASAERQQDFVGRNYPTIAQQDAEAAARLAARELGAEVIPGE